MCGEPTVGAVTGAGDQGGASCDVHEAKDGPGSAVEWDKWLVLKIFSGVLFPLSTLLSQTLKVRWGPIVLWHHHPYTHDIQGDKVGLEFLL